MDNKLQLLVLSVLMSSGVIGQNVVSHKAPLEKQQLQFTCFIEQSFELLDSVFVKVLSRDSLIETKVSDKKGNAVFLWLAVNTQ